VNRWKVIFATLAIFLSGMATGTLLSRKEPPSQTSESARPAPPPEHRKRFMHKIHEELDLTAEQRERIDAIMADSQTEMKAVWAEFSPRMREAYQKSHELIAAELTEEQRVKFEQLLERGRKRRGPDRADRNRRESDDCGPPQDERCDPNSGEEAASATKEALQPDSRC
jgi:Spy/CpxP family protein refolding chaperone